MSKHMMMGRSMGMMLAAAAAAMLAIPVRPLDERPVSKIKPSCREQYPELSRNEMRRAATRENKKHRLKGLRP